MSTFNQMLYTNLFSAAISLTGAVAAILRAASQGLTSSHLSPMQRPQGVCTTVMVAVKLQARLLWLARSLLWQPWPAQVRGSKPEQSAACRTSLELDSQGHGPSRQVSSTAEHP